MELKVSGKDSVGRGLEEQIAAAISASSYRWRTAPAIAKEIKADAKNVSEVLRSSTSFVRAKKPNEKGQALYTTFDRYRKETPFVERLLGAAANTVIQ